MKKTLIILVFLLLPTGGFSQNAPIYNGLSHNYQADPQKTASEYGPMQSGWQWQKSDFSSLSATSHDDFQSGLATSIQPSSVSLPSSYSATQGSNLNDHIQSTPFSGSASIASHESPSPFEQNSTAQLQSPLIRWKFARPQQELEPVMPVVTGKEDEAAQNNPAIVVRGEPNAAVVAEDGEDPGLIAGEEKNLTNWIYVE